jgi:excisionase family DNA binding protein
MAGLEAERRATYRELVDQAPRYLSTAEVAAALQVTRESVRAMIRRGELPGTIRLGGDRGDFRIPVDALAALPPVFGGQE